MNNFNEWFKSCLEKAKNTLSTNEQILITKDPLKPRFTMENGCTVFIGYYPNGNISYKSWCANGKCHNENGPAYIRYDEDGNITEQQYWENGIRIK